MKISVQTGGILDEHGIDEGFRLIGEAGFDCVDFNIDHCLSYGDIVNHRNAGFFDLPDNEIFAQLQVYADAAAKHGVGFGQAHAPFPSYVGDSDETNAYVRKAIEKCLEMCARVHCPWLVVHPAFLAYDAHMDADTEYRLNVEFYSSFIPAMKRTGVKIATENMFSAHNGKVIEACMSDFHIAAQFVDELNAIAGENIFGFCLDVGHAALLKHDLYKVITTLGKRLTVLHVHDNNTETDQHLFPYEGKADWDAFCRGIREIGYSGTLSFETFNGMRTRDEALAPELLHLLHAIGELFVKRIEGCS